MTTMRNPAPRGDSSGARARRPWLNCTLLLATLALSCTAGGQSGDLNQDALGRNSGDEPGSTEPNPGAEEEATETVATEPPATEPEMSSEPTASGDGPLSDGSSSSADGPMSDDNVSASEDETTADDNSSASDDSSGLTSVDSSGPDVAPDAAAPVAPDLSCTVNSDCVVVGSNNHCCPHSSADFVANQTAAQQQAAPVVLLPCPELRCPAERYFATCNAGQCELVDLQDHRLTACDTDDECVLHTSACDADCASDPEPTISLNAFVNEDWVTTVCDPDAPPGCAAATRDYRAAACVEGSCQMLDQ